MSLRLPDLWQHLHRQLFPMLTEELGRLMRRFAWLENGRPPPAAKAPEGWRSPRPGGFADGPVPREAFCLLLLNLNEVVYVD